MTLLSLARIAGIVIAIVIAVYNLIMFLAISESDEDVERFAKRIGIPSLIVAAILISLCH
jgi:hypothetical protein